jgi:hypothetical protein
MKILKKENWWVWLLLWLFSSGTSTIVLGALLDVYRKDAWYAKWQYWVIGALALFLPFTVMLIVFNIEILTKTSAKLNVPGKEIYLSPYVWLILLIIPILGWIFLIVMTVYLYIWTLVMLHRGAGEKYINN